MQQFWFNVKLHFVRWLRGRTSVAVRIGDGAAGQLVVQLPCELVVFQRKHFSKSNACEIVCDFPLERWPLRPKPKDIGSLTWVSQSRAILRLSEGTGASRYSNVVVKDVFSSLGGKYVHDCSAASRAEQVERLCFTLEQA